MNSINETNLRTWLAGLSGDGQGFIELLDLADNEERGTVLQALTDLVIEPSQNNARTLRQAILATARAVAQRLVIREHQARDAGV